MKYLFVFIFLLVHYRPFANDSIIIHRLLDRINQLQPKEAGVFPKGCIPSYRMYSLNKDRYKADVNPFFTGLIAFTLQNLKADLTPTQALKANTIIANTLDVYPIFKNRKKNLYSYNFWPTNNPQIFPNGGWLNLFNKSRSLPDDLDDTVIILLAQQADDSTAKAIHAYMQGFTNGKYKKVTNTFAAYQQIGAYSTWFGKKMPVDFDISVLSNILYFVQSYQLPWTAADSASLFLIEDVIKTNKHKNFANYVSPHYATLPNILYHISRLMSIKPIPSLEKLKPQLIADAQAALATADNFMDKVILSTSLMRWGVYPAHIQVYMGTNLVELIENEQFSFFIASMASMFPDPWKKRLTKLKLGTFYYYCPAYNDLLLLENLVWQKRMQRL